MRSTACRVCFVTILVLVAGPGVISSDAWVPAAQSPFYFAVLVTDVEESVPWYRKTLGLHESDRSHAEDGSWAIVNLSSESLSVEIIRDKRAQAVDRAQGFFKVGFGVPDVDSIAERVARATGTRPRVVNFQQRGLRILQLEDPDGNILQLFSPIEETE